MPKDLPTLPPDAVEWRLHVDAHDKPSVLIRPDQLALSEQRIWRIVRDAYNSCPPEHAEELVACRDCMTKAVKQALAEAAGSTEQPDWLLAPPGSDW